jgi:hypothetical protein
MIFRASIVFLATCAADVCWAQYITRAASRDRWFAALWSASLYLIGAIAVVEYTADHRLLGAAVAGAFVGTAIGVRRAA